MDYIILYEYERERKLDRESAGSAGKSYLIDYAKEHLKRMLKKVLQTEKSQKCKKHKAEKISE